MWNHNDHYHNYLLNQLPSEINRALDVGCGLGVFASKLAQRAKLVDAIDADEITIMEASKIHNVPNVYYQCADLLDVDLQYNSYDVIVSIASLHHMNIEAALSKMNLLLRPSGKLLILGLYKEITVTDYTYSLISVPLNYIYLRRYRSIASTMGYKAPVRPAKLSLKQIKLVANSIIPGYKIKRHLFWRYSLIWKKPM